MGPLLLFEWRQQVRNPAFAAAGALFALFGFVLTVGLGRGDVHANAPYLVVEIAGLLSLSSVFPLGVLVASAVLRDREFRLEEVVFATPIDRRRFLLSRFSGAVLAALAVLALAFLGMIAAAHSGAVDPERLGPFRPGPYLWAFAVVGVPTVLLAASVLFAIGGLTRSAPACHVASVALYVLYFVAATLTGSPLMAASDPSAGPARLAALLDPVGLSAFFEATRTWTLAERNTLLPPLAGNLLANRLVWAGATAGVLALTFRRYRFRLLGEPGRRREPVAGAAVLRPSGPTASPRPGRPRALASLLSTARLEVRLALGGFPFVLLLACWVGYALPELWSTVTSGEYGSGFLPVAGLLAGRLRQPLAVFGSIAVVLWSAETFWRERTVRLEGILHATPVPGAVLLGAKVAALSALAGVLALAGVAVALLVQVVREAPAFEPGVLLASAAAGVVPLVLLAAGSGVLHALAPSKPVGLLFALALAVLVQAGSLVGLEHPLLRFAALPRLAWSDLDGLGDAATAYLWLALHWSAVVALLAVPAGVLLRRPEGESLRARLRALPSRASRREVWTATVLGALALGTGGWLLRGLHEGGWQPSGARLAWKASYERAYAGGAAEPQPRIAAIEARVDLDPPSRGYRVRGTYRLVNHTASPVARLHVTVRREATVEALAVERGRPGPVDTRHGVHPFDLAPPLAPGEAVTLSFDLDHTTRGLSADGPDLDVSTNGSLVLGFRAFPGIGYRASYELQEPRERRKQGLPERGLARAVPDEGGDGSPESPWVDADLTVSTAGDQVAVAPGRLVRVWEEGGRRLFHYRTDGPVHAVLAIASARYEVARTRHAGVDVEAYFHPGHAWNVETVLEAARTSLDVLGARFGPYPHAALRLVEVPSRHAFGGFALPGVVLLTERRVFLVDERREQRIDLVARRVAHEVAHQWWGHLVTPAPADGASLLVEGVTKYAESRVLEAMRGPGQARNLRAFELDRYLTGRGAGAEPPLALVRDEPHLYYSKALLVMDALRDLFGEARLDAALGGFVASRGGPGGRPTAADLVAALRDAATAEERPLVDAWLTEVVTYDLAVEEASAARLPDGRFEVTARVRASLSRTGPDGREAPLPLAESIGVAVLPAGGGAPLASGKHALTSGLQTVTFVVSGEPGTVVVDPDVLRIDRNRADNVRDVEVR